MSNHQENGPFQRLLRVILILANVVIIKTAFTGDPVWYRALFLTLPLIIIASGVWIQKTNAHSSLKNKNNEHYQ
jgi:hypothetical protein